MYKKIKYWFEYKGRYLHRDFIQGIKNLWRWFPIIWKDCNLDHHFIWVLLEQKLINQSKHIGKRGHKLNANRDAERMMTCVRLIQRVRDEYYKMEYTDYQKSEFHFEDSPNNPNYKQLRIEESWEKYDDYFAKYPRIYKQVLKTKNKTFNKSEKSGIAVNIAHINHYRAKKLLFKLLEEHIENWWD